MSVETTTNDSSKQSEFERDVQAVLEELPERFQKFSRKFEESGSTDLIITPEHSSINKEGEETSILLYGSERRTIKRHNFKMKFIAESSNASTAQFWFKHDK